MGRHCHYWHVGQEIHDEARDDSLRAFGLGYLCHLAADTVAHNYFVPRQLVLTASTASVGHAYWESRVETHLGAAYARAAKELIQMDTSQADEHLAQIISPTLFSVGTNRRLFKGLVHLAETRGFQSGLKAAVGRSRWSLTDVDRGAAPGTLLRLHGRLAVGRDAGAEAAGSVGGATAACREDGAAAGAAGGGRTRPSRLLDAAEEHFGLPADATDVLAGAGPATAVEGPGPGAGTEAAPRRGVSWER